MHFQGDVKIEAPREQVWEFLTDPKRASQCAPDLKKLDILDDRRFRVVARAGIGPVKGTFRFDATWLERLAPERARIGVRGKVPGSAVSMESFMVLGEAGPTSTTLHWESEVSVKGLIASVGGRLLQGAADQITQGLFACVKARLEAPVR